MTARRERGEHVETYRGAHVTWWPNPIIGTRYEAYAGGRFLRADTRDGMRELIRHYVTR